MKSVAWLINAREHVVFPRRFPSKYWPVLTLLNFDKYKMKSSRIGNNYKNIASFTKICIVLNFDLTDKFIVIYKQEFLASLIIYIATSSKLVIHINQNSFHVFLFFLSENQASDFFYQDSIAFIFSFYVFTISVCYKISLY